MSDCSPSAWRAGSALLQQCRQMRYSITGVATIKCALLVLIDRVSQEPAVQICSATRASGRITQSVLSELMAGKTRSRPYGRLTISYARTVCCRDWYSESNVSIVSSQSNRLSFVQLSSDRRCEAEGFKSYLASKLRQLRQAYVS